MKFSALSSGKIDLKFLKSVKNSNSSLLLDDVFEKLDEARMDNLLDWVCIQNIGQVFITDTHSERIKNHLEKLSVAYQLINI